MKSVSPRIITEPNKNTLLEMSSNGNKNSSSSSRSRTAIGIIGGSGPEAGMDLFGRVLAAHRRRLGDRYRSDRDAPDLLLWNVPGVGGPRTEIDVTPGTAGGTYEASLEALEGAMLALAPLVGVLCIACHTLHVFVPAILEAHRDTILPSAPSAGCSGSSSSGAAVGAGPSVGTTRFVSIVDVTVRACRARLARRNRDTAGRIPDDEGFRIAILGGPATMDLLGRSPYKRVLDELGEDSVYIPPASAIDVVKTIIWQIKRDGRVPNTSGDTNNNDDDEEEGTAGAALRDYYRLLREMASEHRVGIFVLACTELPLIPTDDRHMGGDTTGSSGNATTGAVEFIDPTELVAEAVLDATHPCPVED